MSFNPYEDEEDEDGEGDEEKEPILSLPGKKKRLGRRFFNLFIGVLWYSTFVTKHHISPKVISLSSVPEDHVFCGSLALHFCFKWVSFQLFAKNELVLFIMTTGNMVRTSGSHHTTENMGNQ